MISSNDPGREHQPWGPVAQGRGKRVQNLHEAQKAVQGTVFFSIFDRALSCYDINQYIFAQMHWPLRVDRTWDYQSCYLDLCSMIKNHSFEYRGSVFEFPVMIPVPCIYIYSMDKNTLLHSFPLTLMFNHNHLYQLAYHFPPRFCKLFHYISSNAKWPDTSLVWWSILMILSNMQEL